MDQPMQKIEQYVAQIESEKKAVALSLERIANWAELLAKAADSIRTQMR